jgi:hypothetical protein
LESRSPGFGSPEVSFFPPLPFSLSPSPSLLHPLRAPLLPRDGAPSRPLPGVARHAPPLPCSRGAACPSPDRAARPRPSPARRHGGSPLPLPRRRGPPRPCSLPRSGSATGVAPAWPRRGPRRGPGVAPARPPAPGVVLCPGAAARPPARGIPAPARLA